MTYVDDDVTYVDDGIGLALVGHVFIHLTSFCLFLFHFRRASAAAPAALIFFCFIFFISVCLRHSMSPCRPH